MRRIWLAGGLVLVLSGLAAAARAQDSSPSGEEQLRIASGIKRESFKKEGDEKREILLRAVTAYRLVPDRFPDDRKSCATAFFRIGEIYRSLGERDLALESFQSVLGYSEEHAVVARALLEIGHIHRRDENLDLAIDLYGQVARQCPGERTHGARAILWIAKCHRAKKAIPEARAVLRGLVTEYEDEHASVLAAYDLLATCWLDEGDAARARAVLEECRDHFRDLADAGEGGEAEYLAKVDKMKAWKLLAKAEAGTR